jgi:pyruvate/2-oxoglutarate dehydrogenase complex dihydrolipoamide dehydrogenase (E3) component
MLNALRFASFYKLLTLYVRSLTEVPKKLVVIGGGIIGLEMVHTSLILSIHTY